MIVEANCHLLFRYIGGKERKGLQKGPRGVSKDGETVVDAQRAKLKIGRFAGLGRMENPRDCACQKLSTRHTRKMAGATRGRAVETLLWRTPRI